MSDDPSGAESSGGNSVSGTDLRTAIDADVDLDALCRLATDVLVAEGIEGGQLDVHLMDPDDMAALNLEHMGHEGPTDVLSFPLGLIDDFATIDGDVEVGPQLLGDVVLCPSVAAAQAPEHAGSLDGELSLLVIHGVLHILGHDHAETDEMVVMQAKERWHLARRGLTHPVPDPLEVAVGDEA
jgi:probable rRNA maturation factor